MVKLTKKKGDNMSKINYRTAKKTIQKMSIGQTFNLWVMDPDNPHSCSIKKTADGYWVDGVEYDYHAFKYSNDFFKFLKGLFRDSNTKKGLFSNTKKDLTIGELL